MARLILLGAVAVLAAGAAVFFAVRRVLRCSKRSLRLAGERQAAKIVQPRGQPS